VTCNAHPDLTGTLLCFALIGCLLCWCNLSSHNILQVDIDDWCAVTYPSPWFRTESRALALLLAVERPGRRHRTPAKRPGEQESKTRRWCVEHKNNLRGLPVMNLARAMPVLRTILP
jgi:hypothetical protein